MVSKSICTYCREYWNVENYDKAISDSSQVWHCHHRRETRDLKTGEKLKEFISKAQLLNQRLYYDRPAEELIFLTSKEHRREHKGAPTRKRNRQRPVQEKKIDISLTEEEKKEILLKNIRFLRYILSMENVIDVYKNTKYSCVAIHAKEHSLVLLDAKDEGYWKGITYGEIQNFVKSTQI